MGWNGQNAQPKQGKLVFGKTILVIFYHSKWFENGLENSLKNGLTLQISRWDKWLRFKDIVQRFGKLKKLEWNGIVLRIEKSEKMEWNGQNGWGKPGLKILYRDLEAFFRLGKSFWSFFTILNGLKMVWKMV